MIEPKIETLLEGVDSKYTLVLLAAKRGRQINSYFPAGRRRSRVHPTTGASAGGPGSQGPVHRSKGDLREQGHLRTDRRRHQVTKADA